MIAFGSFRDINVPERKDYRIQCSTKYYGKYFVERKRPFLFFFKRWIPEGYIVGALDWSWKEFWYFNDKEECERFIRKDIKRAHREKTELEKLKKWSLQCE